jgi:hypothetical protein
MSKGKLKSVGASLHTLVVYEDGEGFSQYAGTKKLPVAVYDRERSVLEAARRVAVRMHLPTVRVVFIIECPEPENCSIVNRSKGPTTPPPLRSQKNGDGISQVKNEQC